VAERVADKRMLKLIRAFLKAGVMEDGLVSAVDEGTPQGGPVLQTLESWLHRRLRSVVWKQWKQWKQGRTRLRELRNRGVGKDLAAQTAGSPHGTWRIANSPALAIALPNAYFAQLSLPPMVVRPA
jgi:RNA-directed DNA polymerase